MRPSPKEAAKPMDAARPGRTAGGMRILLMRGSSWSVGLNFVGAALSFAVQVLLARVLGVHGYGAYSYAMAWMNAALLLGRLEVDTAAIRFVGAYFGTGTWNLLRGFLLRGFGVVMAASAMTSALGAALVFSLSGHLEPHVIGPLLACALLLPPTALLLLSSASLQGLKKIPAALFPNLLLRPFLFGCAVLGLGLLGGLGAGRAILLNAAATVVALGVSLRLMWRALPAETRGGQRKYADAEWRQTVRAFVVIAGAQYLLSQQVDVVAVGTLLGTEDAALYSAASQLVSLIGFGATAVVFVANPVIAHLHAAGNRAELQRVVDRTVFLSTALSVPVVLGLLLFGSVALGLYGNAFRAAYPVLAILTVGQAAGAMFGIVAGFVMTMTGHERRASRIIVLTGVLNAMLTIVLTPMLGAIGAATATAGATTVKLVLLAVAARRDVGIMVAPRPRIWSSLWRDG